MVELKRKRKYKKVKWKNVGLLTVATTLLAGSVALFISLHGDEVIDPVVKAKEIDPVATIFLDPGHGGYDDGAVVSGEKEKEINLSIALKVKTILEKNNFEVVLSRTDDVVAWPSDNRQDLQMRIDLAVAAKADLFVSLHCNTSAYSDVTGYEVWYVNTVDSIALSELMSEHLSNLPFGYNRGTHSTDISRLHVLDYNPIPSILIEMGFMTNASDLAYLTSEEGQNELAMQIARGIIDSQS
ncbi:MAG: N-acetylmuramoyl-L-alanine amidase [Erysipelotrichaceae bacterium]